ncbi:hypothetical protein [Afifella sp. IM 167]|uniref:hypothetical protein n=1 Tax=Afifella sp. IM 167 TaxID=2033586 RepID=UPI001CCA15B3|nr:hypothetical protein [Afifella sp. IM 167]MBZ8134288.1 hypothetical protein [Afifella sp. IM 167]
MTLPRLRPLVLVVVALALLAAGISPWLNDHAAMAGPAMTGVAELAMTASDDGDHPCCADAGKTMSSDCAVCLVGTAFMAAPLVAAFPQGESLARPRVASGNPLAGIDLEASRPPPRMSAFY